MDDFISATISMVHRAQRNAETDFYAHRFWFDKYPKADGKLTKALEDRGHSLAKLDESGGKVFDGIYMRVYRDFYTVLYHVYSTAYSKGVDDTRGSILNILGQSNEKDT